MSMKPGYFQPLKQGVYFSGTRSPAPEKDRDGVADTSEAENEVGAANGSENSL